MKIVRAMKQISRLQGEIKEFKKRISNCLSTLEENDFDEYYKELSSKLNEKIKKLIELKSRIMHTNIKYKKFTTILNLGELKSYIDFLRELDPQQGVQQRAYEDSTKFKSQITISEKNKLIENYQKMINDLTDELDDFNAKTDLEELEVTVRHF